MAIELSLLDIIEGRKAAPIRLTILKLLSQFLRLGVAIRHFAYDKGFFRRIQLPIPVISVGNILVGGSGKTPFVHLLAHQLAMTRKVAIVSRGYRAKVHRKEPFLISASHCATFCGDEPLLLARKLPQVEVIVGADRVTAARFAYSRGAEVILLDDGMQHRHLHREVDIALLPSDNLFGGGWFLPGGLLRDAPKRLSQVDLIAITNVRDGDHFAICKEQLIKYSQAPVIGLKMVVKNSAVLSGKRVGAFCAIARPQRFIRTLEEIGCEVVHRQFFPDHGSFSSLEKFEKEAYQKGAEILVCTEKDAVKTHCQCTPVEIELVPYFEAKLLQQLMETYQ